MFVGIKNAFTEIYQKTGFSIRFYTYLLHKVWWNFISCSVDIKSSIARSYTVMICSTMTVWLHIKITELPGFIHVNTFSSNFYRVGGKFKRENKFFICKCSRIRSGYCRESAASRLAILLNLKWKPCISSTLCFPQFLYLVANQMVSWLNHSFVRY